MKFLVKKLSINELFLLAETILLIMMTIVGELTILDTN